MHNPSHHPQIFAAQRRSMGRELPRVPARPWDSSSDWYWYASPVPPRRGNVV